MTPGGNSFNHFLAINDQI